MKDNEFYERVQDRADLDSTDGARDTTTATLKTLSQAVSQGQAEDVTVQLPEELGDSITDSHGDAEAFSCETFLDRVSTCEDDHVGGREIDDRVRAVMGTLADAVSDEQLADLRNQIPGDFERFFDLAETEADVE